MQLRGEAHPCWFGSGSPGLPFSLCSALSASFLVAAFTVHWGILIVSFMHQLVDNDFHNIELNIESLVAGDFAAGAVLISFGALIGKVALQSSRNLPEHASLAHCADLARSRFHSC